MGADEKFSLAQVFCAHLPDTADALNMEQLQKQLDEAIVRGRAAWPDAGTRAEDFARHLATVCDDPHLVSDSHADLWLACGTLAGDPPALAALHKLLGELARVALSNLGLNAAGKKDVVQAVESRLLTGTPSSAPALRNYRGQSSLKTWLRVALVRQALRDRKVTDGERPLEEGVLRTLALDANDPETGFIKDHYLQAFRAAFRAALAELGDRDRNLLRYLVLDGLAVENVASLYRVNRTTVWRWMASIRDALLKKTRQQLREALGVNQDELDSIMRLIQSRLSATLSDLHEPDARNAES